MRAQDRPVIRALVAVAVLALGAFMIVRTAWVSDDAQITLRTVLNLVNGYGPVYNLDERVQAYTHPLWFLLLSGVAVTGVNVFWAALGLAGVVTAVALFLLVWKLAVTPWHGLAAGLVLLFSKAFLDYSTSGLENPLAHLLLLLVVVAGLAALDPDHPGRGLGFVPLLGGLLYLTRPDLVLLAAPFAGYVWLRAPVGWGRRGLALLPGVLVVLAWTAFSLVYYGFPLPNTAYAKLGNGVPRSELVGRGLQYLWESVQHDPLTLAAIAAALLVVVAVPAWQHLWLMTGVVLYLGYVVWIGGDFMSGRFLTAPLLVAVVVLARSRLSRPLAVPLVVGGLVLAVLNLPATLLSGPDYSNQSFGPTGVADERGFYYQRWGLLAPDPARYAVPQWVADGERTVTVIESCGLLGTNGLQSGPAVHWVDPCGLADPLLARLAPEIGPDWRIGHFARAIPDGYLDSIAGDANLLTDPGLRAFYGQLRLATRGQLFTAERWTAITELNRA